MKTLKLKTKYIYIYINVVGNSIWLPVAVLTLKTVDIRNELSDFEIPQKNILQYVLRLRAFRSTLPYFSKWPPAAILDL